MTNIDEFGQFTEDNWFSKHQLNCGLYSSQDCTCDKDPERSLMIMTMGLAGEVGEVMEILKKRVRDGKFDIGELTLELGDVVHYWARICRHFDLVPSEVLEANIRKLKVRREQRKC